MVRVCFHGVEVSFVAICIALVATSCSPGLEGFGSSTSSGASIGITSTNLRFGFDPGLVPTDPIAGTDIAGGVLPGVNGDPDRPVVFLAFATEARANNGDGAGTPLDRSSSPPTDVAGTSDIFVAAITADMIDERAFVYSLAGTFRHPRCTTCHSMNVTAASGTLGGPSTAFTTGPPHPGASIPVGIQANCSQCHDVVDWRAPPSGLDLRNLPVSELFMRSQQAISGTGGPEDHFETDSRVLWALGSDGGRLPFGNVADDDHDGIPEPEDNDGTVRTVPGGVAQFLGRIRDWKESGQKFDSSDALHDVVLASRASSGNAAGNGDSHSPSSHYRPNAAFTPGVSNPDLVPVGFLRVAFASEATNMVGGTGNGVSDIFWIDVNVFHRSNGVVDLITNIASQTLVSRATAGDPNGASTSPELGGTNGERVAFVSTATNLVAGFQNNNGAAADVFAALPSLNFVVLVSHIDGIANATGDGESTGARLDPTGTIVAFESDATNFGPGAMDDMNGVRDVFYADAFQFGFEVERASVASGGAIAGGGNSYDPSVYAFPGTTHVRIAYTSAKTDLVSGGRPGAENVYLFDSRTAGGTTTLLNRIAGPAGVQPLAMNSASQNAGNAEISGDGNTVLFESMSANIDFVRSNDDNDVMDVMLADLALLETEGFVLPYTLSVTTEGGSANAASSSPSIASLTPASDAFPLGVAAFRTAATNLTNSDVTGDADANGIPDFDNLVLMFVREGATVVADFEASPEKQGMGRVVTFESTSSGNPTTFSWDFGDGGTSTDARPTHVYQTPGLYSVMLSASGELGFDMRQRTDYVQVVGPSDAMFTSTKDSTLSGVAQDPASNIPNAQTIRGALDPNMASSLTFEFNDADSTECPETFDWRLTEVDIASGMPIAAPVTVGNSEDATTDVTISSRAHYDMELVATGPGGAGASATQRIEVWNRAEASFTPTTAVVGEAPLTVTFQDTSTGDVESIRWQSNGADFSTQSQPTEAFGEGVFQVRVIARGRGQDEDTSASVTITSFGDLTASFTPNDLEEIRSTSRIIDFSNQTMGTPGVPLSYRWTFGNGQTSTLEEPPLQTYNVSTENVTTYNVNLVASTAGSAPVNCTGMPATDCDEANGTLTFYPQANPSVSVTTSGTNPHLVTMNPSVLGDGVGTNPSYVFLRSSAGGTTPNITLGTFSNANTRTFNVAAIGVYRFAVRLETNGPNGSRQSQTSSSVIREVFADFSQDVFSLLTASCLSCHTSTASCAVNGLLRFDNPPTSASLYDDIVGVSANFCSGTCTGQPTLLINAGSTNPQNSWLYKKITAQDGACGGPMPPGTSGMSTSARNTISSWIRGGSIE